MKYEIDISEIDCRFLIGSQDEGETDEQFSVRCRAHEGNSIFRVTALNDGGILTMQSPWFRTDRDADRNLRLHEIMQRVGTLIANREHRKTHETPSPA